MGKIEYKRPLLYICFSVFSFYSFAVNPDKRDIESQRQAIINHAKEFVGITEATGNNDGKQIEIWQRNVNIPKGSPYCAAFVCSMFLDLSIPAPLTGYSPAMFTANIIYKQKDWRDNYTFPVGSVFGMYFKSKGRVAHVGIIESTDKNKITTIQANTSMSGSIDLNNLEYENIREGDGVARKIVNRYAIYIVADYIANEKNYDWRKGIYKK